jgi:molecular chaperone IbpA
VWPASTTTWPAKRVWDDLFMIGFDKLLDKTINNTGFPFYNVSKMNDNEFEVEIALAGFSKDDIEIEEKKSSLIISGNAKDNTKDYVYKGISSKSFTRSFALAEHVHVKDAYMNNGMLSIKLVRDIPEEEQPKRITVK